MRKLILFGIVGLLLNGIAMTAGAAEKHPDTEANPGEENHGWFDATLFHDEKDGQFDISNFMASRHGFMPVPIIITGPTLGTGITGVAAAATENGSRLVALTTWASDSGIACAPPPPSADRTSIWISTRKSSAGN